MAKQVKQVMQAINANNQAIKASTQANANNQALKASTQQSRRTSRAASKWSHKQSKHQASGAANNPIKPRIKQSKHCWIQACEQSEQGAIRATKQSEQQSEQQVSQSSSNPSLGKPSSSKAKQQACREVNKPFNWSINSNPYQQAENQTSQASVDLSVNEAMQPGKWTGKQFEQQGIRASNKASSKQFEHGSNGATVNPIQPSSYWFEHWGSRAANNLSSKGSQQAEKQSIQAAMDPIKQSTGATIVDQGPVELTIGVMGAWYESRRGQNVMLFSGGNDEAGSNWESHSEKPLRKLQWEATSKVPAGSN
jgi:hypothetical protein